MSELEIKKETRDRLYLNLIHLNNRLLNAQEVVQDLKLALSKAKEEFDTLDREIAMENITVVPAYKVRTKRANVKAFSLSEVQELALKLGIKLEITP